MMTIHKLSAGDGYRYYVQETASGDVHRPIKNDLGDYYTAKGNPPGVWTGAGAALLGVTGTVSEEQMAALFGEGLHPDADRIIRAALDEGLSVAEATRRARLGRRYYRYDQSGPLTARIQDALEAFAARAGREATPDERRRLRAQAGAVAFREDFGRSPKDSGELGRYISASEAPKQQAVAGWDLVMKAPEDISKGLFGAGDDEVCHVVMECDDLAARDTLAWIEEHALATRTGINGIAQEDVQGGLIATMFRHHDNRLGEPFLHHHVVISNKVRGTDGKWRAVDGKLLYAMGVAASEFYNQRVVELVCRRLSLEAEEREVTPGKRPVMGIKGFDIGVLEPHSQRTRDIRGRLETLLREYRRQHRSEPTTAVRMALIQQATLETRAKKKKHTSLAEMRKRWRTAAVAAVGEARVAGLLRAAQGAARRPPAAGVEPGVDVAEAAQDVLTTVSEYRSVWGERHVLAEARRHIVRLTGGLGTEDGLAERIVQQVLTTSLSITPPDLHRPFAPLLRTDGTSIYRRRESVLYTSQDVLDAEARVVHAARTQVIPALARQQFASVAEAFEDSRLDPGQLRLAEEFACSTRLVIAGIGPAGSGKTTALQLVRDAVNTGGGRLIPLAPSSRAAKVMEDKLGVTSFTLHGWLAQREQMDEGVAVRPTRKKQDAKAQQRYELRPGDVIIVDEAGMAGSANLARVVAQAEAAGALVRLIGDPFQLGSVESGGLLRQLSREIGAVELSDLHRFADPDEAAATLALRDGDPADAWRWHVAQQRVVGGTREEMLDGVFAAWQADTDAGLDTVMMADDTDAVRELNARAQAVQLAAGRLDVSRTTDLRDEFQAGVGDVIVTRKNARRLSVLAGRDHVKNGDQWVIETIDRRGAVRVRHTGHGGRVVLPPGYLRQHAELGYACTVHRAQGLTVQTAHGLITARTARESAYVEATRGWASNHLYVVTDEGQTMHDVLDSVARSSQASVSAHDTIRDEQDRAYNIGQLAAEYTDVHARAGSARLQSITRRVLAGSAEMFIGAEAWGVLERTLRTAEGMGWDLGLLITEAFAERDFADAEDCAAVLAWRIDHRVEEGARAAERAAAREAEPGRSRPLKELSADQLGHLLAIAQRHRRDALDELARADSAVSNQPRPVTADGLPHPAWPLRAHGDLTRTQLAEALFGVRAAIRRAAHDNDQDAEAAAVREHALLRREQQLRRAMPPRDRMREEWQREPRTGASHTARQPLHATIAELKDNLHRQDNARESCKRAEIISNKILAEQRLRQRLPHGPARVPDHGGLLPDWLAPSDAVRDADTPEGWRQHLVERRLVLSQRLQDTGAALAHEQPAWTRPLGPVPPAETELREEWERTVALADAWRVRHGVPEAESGIGDQPAEVQEADAWKVMRERIASMGRRARATHFAHRRPQVPTSGMRIAARTAAAIHDRLLNDRLAGRADRTAVAVAASAFADLALQRAVQGTEPVEQWVEQIPLPEPGDEAQAEQWKQLVAAVDTYRMVNRVDSSQPLGENSEVEAPDRRAELHAALSLFQRSRIQQRLEEVRTLRDAQRDQRVALPGAAPVISAGPARTCRDVERDEQQYHRRPRPGHGRGQ